MPQCAVFTTNGCGGAGYCLAPTVRSLLDITTGVKVAPSFMPIIHFARSLHILAFSRSNIIVLHCRFRVPGASQHASASSVMGLKHVGAPIPRPRAFCRPRAPSACLARLLPSLKETDENRVSRFGRADRLPAGPGRAPPTPAISALPGKTCPSEASHDRWGRESTGAVAAPGAAPHR